jgi:hypothetical protein
MLALDLNDLDSKLEAERVRVVAVLRGLANRLEALPPTRLRETLLLLETPVTMLEAWTMRLWKNERTSAANGAKTAAGA